MRRVYTLLFALTLCCFSIINSYSQISFDATPLSGCAPLTVTFTNTTTDTNAVNYYLYFGDGNSSTKVDTTYTYSNAGDYYPYVNAYNTSWNYLGSYNGNMISAIGATYISSTADSACPGDVISFSNYNQNATTWSWDFGDGNFSSYQYPSHTYSSTGSYTVTLTVATSCGTFSSVKNINITNSVPAQPIGFGHNPNPACINTSINHYPYSNASSYSWNFGDGFSDTVANPNHIYLNPGTYAVTLTTTNGCGNTASYTDSAYIVSYMPFDSTVTIDISPDSACPNENIGMWAPYNGTSYVFDYGDGSPLDSGSSYYRSHVYSSLGNYNLSARVYNGCGNDTTYTVNVPIVNTIGFLNPVNLTNNSPACPGETVQLSAGYGYLAYVWNYGDGSPQDSLDLYNGGWNRNHNYNSVGTYIASVTLYNNCGNDTTLYTTVTISNTEPVPAYVSVNNNSPACPGSNVNIYTDYGFDSYVWNYGDGSPVDSLGTNGEYRNHTYSSIGTYTASVTIYNSCGNDTILYTTVTISNTEPVPNYVNASNNSPACPGSNVNISASSGFASYVWDYGDGSPVDSLVLNGNYTYHTYSSVGTYNASVTIYNSCGNDTTLYTTVTISNNEPIPNYVYINNTSPACPGSNISLYTSGGFSAYVWDYGDGSGIDSLGANGEYRNHVYLSVGTYPASVTIYNSCGNDTTLYTTINIINDEPIPNYVSAGNNSPACPGGTVQLSADYGFTTYIWNYGDGSPADTGTIDNGGWYRYHVYSSVGTYTASVTIYNNCGNDSTLYTTIDINTNSPFSSSVYFNHGPNEACPNDNIQFYAESGYVKYKWNYGDGSPAEITNNDSYSYHQYLSAGTYYTSVTITNACGNDTIINDSVVISNYAPFPSWISVNSNNSVCPGQSTSFNVNYGGASFQWNFGDGSAVQNTQNNNVNHTFSVQGSYTVSVTVTNNCGNDTTLSTNIMVEYQPFPPMNINANSNPACPGQPVELDVQYGFYKYIWNFGDGSPAYASYGSGNANHAYNDTGTYTVSVKILNNCGIDPYQYPSLYTDTTIYTSVVISNNVEFSGNTTINISQGNCSSNYGFNTSEGYESYVWDFGDGDADTTNYGNAYHVYSDTGAFIVTLTIANYCGYDTTITASVYHDKAMYGDFTPDTTNLYLIPSPDPACPGQNVSFSNNSSYWYSYYFQKSVWNFGDGSPEDSSNGNGTTGLYNNHTFSSIGTYTASVDITHQCGNDTTVYATVVIDSTVGFPNGAYLNAGPNDPCLTQQVSFYAPSGFLSYTWDFGDSSSLVTNSVYYAYHSYSAAGSYTAAVTITNFCGNDTTVYKTVNVVDYKPFPSYSYLNANPVNPCPGENVGFYYEAGWENVSAEWNFGDSTPTVFIDLDNGCPGCAGNYIQHTYADTGTYTASVTVTNFCGNDTTIYAAVNVVGYKPFPNWTSLNSNPPSSACPGDMVYFSSTYGYASYAWDFGDGKTGPNYPNVNHTYDSLGTYTAMVTITNFCGNDTTVSKTINIEGDLVFGPYTPYGESWYLYNWPYSACPGQNVNFNAPQGLPYYTWDFGDGNVDSTSNYNYIGHKYNAAGTYTVALTVRNNCGSDTTLYTNVVIDNNLGFSNLYMNINPTSACPSQEVQINGPYGYASYLFDYGDGSPVDSSDYSNTSHSFPSEGTYNVGLTIYNYCGLDTTIYAPVTIDTGISFTYAPNVSAWPSNICPGQEVNFYAESGHMSYLWNFDDGSQAQGSSNVHHSFDSIGTYGVDVTITNFCGSDTTVSVNVGVSDTISAFPNMGMDISPLVSCPGDMVELSANEGFSSYFWTFGDGDTLTSSGNKVQHIFSSPGSFNASLMVTNGCGFSTTVYESVTINSNAPVDTSLSINVPFNPNCPGDEVFFNVYNGAATYIYNWDFGDGSSDSTVGTGTSHVFADTGYYPVVLTATNGCGSTKSITVSAEINNSVVPFVEAGETFGFGTGESSGIAGCPGDAILFWFAGTADNLWDFGDGSSGTATEQVMTEMGVPVTVIKHIYSSAGTYSASLTLTNNCGNSTTDSISLVIGGNLLVNGDIFIAPPTGTAGYTTCSSIDMIGTGGSNYSWDFGDGDTISTASPTISHTYSNPGTYTVSVKVINGCGYNATYYSAITVNGIGGPSATVTGNAASCFGGNDGNATVTVNDGIAPFTFAWDASAGAQTGATATGLAAGTYSVNVVDNLGCSTIESVTISQPTDMAISSATTSSTCGVADGSATVAVSGGAGGPYTYVWSSGATDSTSTGLAAGNFTVTVTNASGCQKVANISVNNGNSATAAITSSSNISCYGTSDGDIDISVSGGTSPYTYLWSNSATTEDLTGLSAGTYSLTVTDANNCVSGQSVTITQPNDLALTTSVTNANCGSFNGSAAVNVSGGTASYSYLWDENTGNKTTATVTGLPAGQYEVLVTDANGCTDSITAVISNANAPVITAVATNVTCNGDGNGSITQTVTGGTNPYLYNWSNGANTKNISGLSPGSYTVIITDASNCVSIRNYTITQPELLAASATPVSATCGNADGSATVSATGGITSYSYLWSDGQAASTATGLAAGIYPVTVTDSNGCTAAASATVTQPSTFASTIASDSVNCNGGNDGMASAAPAGGNPPYSYLWASSETTDSISGLPAGSYSVTITDANGCTSENSVTVEEPAVLSVSFSVTGALCFGNANGSADAAVSGGTEPYAYLWSDGAVTAALNNLAAGTYSLTITDANNCTLEDSAVVNEPAQLTAVISGTNANCYNVCDGTASVVPDGGTSPYSYLWSNGDNTASADSLCDGNFVVNISDVNNCQATQNISITEPDTLTVSVSSIGTTCGNTDGSATATATGGTEPYAYLWSDSQADSMAIGLGTGAISVTVTDNNGCLASASDTIGTYVPPIDICIVTVDSTSTKNLIVWEKPNVNYIDSFRVYRDIVGTYTYIGSVDYIDLSKFVDTTNGVNPNITSYKYQVSVVDNCGNESAMSGYHKTMHLQTIFQSGEVDMSWDNYDGFGTNFFYRILRDSTGTGNWQVLDSVSYGNTQYTDIAPPTGLLNYMMEVVHPYGGCFATKSVENHNSSRSNRGQTANAAPLSASTLVTDATQGICDGTATVTAGGGIAPYTYLWNDSFNQTTETATGLCAGSYTVTVTDVNGDTITASVTVGVQPGMPELSLENAVKVYPNPNKGEFTVQFSALTVNSIKIYNILGEIVYQTHIPGLSSQLSIDLGERGSGLYYLQVSGENGTVNKRIIIE